MVTALHPSASAFKTSVPRVTPPSRTMSTLPPAASAISGSVSMVPLP